MIQLQKILLRLLLLGVLAALPGLTVGTAYGQTCLSNLNAPNAVGVFLGGGTGVGSQINGPKGQSFVAQACTPGDNQFESIELVFGGNGSTDLTIEIFAGQDVEGTPLYTVSGVPTIGSGNRILSLAGGTGDRTFVVGNTYTILLSPGGGGVTIATADGTSITGGELFFGDMNSNSGNNLNTEFDASRDLKFEIGTSQVQCVSNGSAVVSAPLLGTSVGQSYIPTSLCIPTGHDLFESVSFRTGGSGSGSVTVEIYNGRSVDALDLLYTAPAFAKPPGNGGTLHTINLAGGTGNRTFVLGQEYTFLFNYSSGGTTVSFTNDVMQGVSYNGSSFDAGNDLLFDIATSKGPAISVSDNAWSSQAAWSTNALPTSDRDVIIDTKIDLNINSPQYKSLQITSTGELFATNNNYTNNTVTLPEDIINDGIFRWSTASFVGDNGGITFTNRSGATAILNPSNASQTITDIDFVNESGGAINHTISSAEFVYNDVMTNEAGGTITVGAQNDGNDPSLKFTGTFVNSGDLVIGGADGTKHGTVRFEGATITSNTGSSISSSACATCDSDIEFLGTNTVNGTGDFEPGVKQVTLKTGATLSGTNALIIPVGTVFNVESGATIDGFSSITNNGTINFLGNATGPAGGITLTNTATGTVGLSGGFNYTITNINFVNQSGGLISRVAVGTNGAMNLAGSVVNETGATISTSGGRHITFQSTLENNGTIDGAGLATLEGATSGTGSFPVATVTSTGSLSPGGTSVGQMDFIGQAIFAGTLNINVNGTTSPGVDFDQATFTSNVRIDPTAVLNVTVGYTPQVGDQVTILDGNSLTNNAKFGTNININTTGWSVVYNLPTNGDVTLVYTDGKAIAAQTGNWSDASTWVGGIIPISTLDVVIPAGVEVTLDVANPQYNSITVESLATLDIGASGLNIATIFVNNGTISGTGPLTMSGAVSGSGSFASNSIIASGGSHSPGNSPGIASFPGTYDLQGTLNIEVNGKTTAGTEYDLVTVTNTLTLGANSILNVTIGGGYTPISGDKIVFIDAGSITGNNNEFGTANIPAGWVLDINPTTGEVSLEYMPTNPALEFVVSDEIAGPGELVIVSISVNNFTDIGAFQGTIEYDASLLTYTTHNLPNATVTPTLGPPNGGSIPAGSITFGWAPLDGLPKTLSDGEVVMELVFTVSGTAQEAEVATVEIDNDGTYPLTPLGFTNDPSGTMLIEPGVDPGQVLVDATAPNLVSTDIFSDNSNPIYAKVGDKVTLSFTTSEDLGMAPEVTFTTGNGAKVVTATGSGTIWSAEFTVVSGDDGLVSFSVEMKDLYNNSETTAAQTSDSNGDDVTIDTVDPVISCPFTGTEEFDNTLGVCEGDVIFAAATATDIGGTGASVTQTAGPSSGATLLVDEPETVTFRATDLAGNFVECSFVVVVKDTEAPTVVTKNITVELGVNGTVSIAEDSVNDGSSDNCADFANLTFDTDITSFDCDDLGPNDVFLTVTDTSNNSATSTVAAVVTVQDNIDPTVTAKDFTLELDVNGNGTLLLGDVLDASDDNCNVVVTLSQEVFSCEDLGTVNVTLTATDDAGNTATDVAVVTVVDVTAPIINCVAGINMFNDPGQCGAVVSFPDPVVTDNCSDLGSGPGGSMTFSYTGAPETWVVPTGVTEVTVTALGAEGGNNIITNIPNLQQPGKGGQVSGTLAVTPGETLYIYVGGEGGDYNNGGGQGGFNGGGSGVAPGWGPGGGAGGGGATDLRQGGQTLADRVLVAGGGGGGADRGNGGDGGFMSGTSGSDWIGNNPAGPSPAGLHGQGGTQSMGGVAGINGDGDGTAGSLGIGGAGGAGFKSGGGGGGGYYGGGGGSGIIAGNTVTGGGGGGSSYIGGLNPGATTSNGVRSGHGELTISWSGSTPTMTLTQTTGLPSGSLFPVGTTLVTFEAEDASGNKSQCSFNVTVTDNEAPTVITKNITVELGPDGTVSIAEDAVNDGSNDNCTDLASLTFDTDKTTFTCDDIGANTVTLTVTDMATPTPNSASLTATVTVENNPTAIISGAAATDYGSPIASVDFDLVGTDGPQSATASTYSFQVVPCASDNEISADKAEDPTSKNAINIQDAINIVRHVLFIRPFNSEYVLVAADVNHTRTINVIDALQVARKVANIKSAFTDRNSGLEDENWLFLRSDYSFTSLNDLYESNTVREYDFVNNAPNSASGQDFVGILLGDVDSSYSSAGNRTIRPEGSVYFTMKDVVAQPGDQIRIPVRVRDFDQISGYQFTMNWDASVMQLAEVADRGLENGIYNLEEAANGYLSTAWFDLQGQSVSLDEHAVAFELVFDVVGDWRSSTELSISSDITPSQAYNQQDKLLEVRTQTAMVSVGEATNIDGQDFVGYGLSQNVPNPFSGETVLNFSLGQSEEVSIAIYNAVGQVVWSHRSSFAAGQHELKWNGRSQQGAEVSQGMYFVRLQAGEYNAAISIKKLK